MSCDPVACLVDNIRALRQGAGQKTRIGVTAWGRSPAPWDPDVGTPRGAILLPLDVGPQRPAQEAGAAWAVPRPAPGALRAGPGAVASGQPSAPEVSAKEQGEPQRSPAYPSRRGGGPCAPFLFGSRRVPSALGPVFLATPTHSSS